MHRTRSNPHLASCVGAAGAVLVGLATACSGSIVFSTQGTLPPPREQLLFNGDGLTLSGVTIQGHTNATGSIIDCMGGEGLFTTGSGQAGIAADDGGFTTLTIEPADDLLVFTGIGFNLFAVEDGSVTISAVTTTGTETQTPDLRRNGQNRFVLTTDDSQQFLQSVTLSSTVDLSDVRQVRLQNLAPIPEPATLGLLGMGGLLALRRRR